MGKFQSTLKDLRKSFGLTQDELAKKLKLSRSTIGMYEKGAREPDFETLELIADFFNVDINYLLGRTAKTTVVPTSRRGVSIPVYGRVAAGIPLEMIEDIVDTEEIPEDMARTGTYFSLRIHGDSMEPRIKDGDNIIIRHQEDAESGEIVVASVNGSDATCKRLKKYKEGISLISTNPSYEPMFFTNKEIEEKPVRILGKVVELRAKF